VLSTGPEWHRWGWCELDGRVRDAHGAAAGFMKRLLYLTLRGSSLCGALSSRLPLSQIPSPSNTPSATKNFLAPAVAALLNSCSPRRGLRDAANNWWFPALDKLTRLQHRSAWAEARDKRATASMAVTYQ
jgi:hypothetical protein